EAVEHCPEAGVLEVVAPDHFGCETVHAVIGENTPEDSVLSVHRYIHSSFEGMRRFIRSAGHNRRDSVSKCFRANLSAVSNSIQPIRSYHASTSSGVGSPPWIECTKVSNFAVSDFSTVF